MKINKSLTRIASFNKVYTHTQMPAVAAILISLLRCQARFPAFQGVLFFIILGANKKNLLRSLICCYMDITRTFFCSLDPFCSLAKYLIFPNRNCILDCRFTVHGHIPQSFIRVKNYTTKFLIACLEILLCIHVSVLPHIIV